MVIVTVSVAVRSNGNCRSFSGGKCATVNVQNTSGERKQQRESQSPPPTRLRAHYFQHVVLTGIVKRT